MIVTQGPQVINVAEGILGVGLLLDGTATLSGAAAGLSTTAKRVSFDTDDQLWTTRKPRLIRMRCVGQTLTIALGDMASSEIIAADTWSAWLPCTALFNGKDDWWVTAGAETALEYEIAYT